MARMIPAIDPKKIENKGESELYAKIRDQLPSGWSVRYHYPICWRQGRYLRDCEIDFIILAPTLGLLVLEAKSSHGYDCVAGQWYRVKKDETREATDNPFDQATTCKHRLVERIALKVFNVDKLSFPGLFGHVVVYPFGKVLGSLPASIEPSLLLSQKDMSSLRSKLESCYAAWGPPQRGAYFNASAFQRVEQFLSDDAQLVPVVASNVDQDDQAIESLTLSQFTAFRGVLRNARVHVQGPAGTGKTHLALWAARAAAEKGEKTLYLCYNRVLAAWLNRKESSSENLEIRTFFSLCREVVEESKQSFLVPSGDQEAKRFWESSAVALFNEALNVVAKRYDAIFVDEAQDFQVDWWLPVQLCLKDPDHGKLCVFSDPDQAGLYGHGEGFPDKLISYDLLENCRNTRRITHYCGKIISRDLVPFTLCPEGLKPEVTEPEIKASARAEKSRRLIAKLLDEGFSAGRIAVLSPWRKGTPESTLSHLDSAHGKPISGEPARIGEWITNKIIWGSTIKSFKGLEADCVVLTDIPLINTLGFTPSDLYVAVSRAKHRLFVIPSSIESAGQLISWVKKIC